MSMGNQTGEWVNLYGSDGKIKARLNSVTMELVVKERGVYHSWRLAAMVNLRQNMTEGQLPVEIATAR